MGRLLEIIHEYIEGEKFMSIQSFNVQRNIHLDIIADTGLYAGTAYGSFSPRDKTRFRISTISMLPEYLNDTVIMQALSELISLAQDEGAKSFSWRYDEPEDADYTDENNDPHIRIMRSVSFFFPEYEMTRRIHGRDYKIDLKILPERMQHNYHISEQWLSDGGIEFIPVERMKPFIPQISELADEDPDAALLSPLGVRDYDTDTSFITVCNGEVMGWVICRRIDDETVDFMEFYTAKKFRTYKRGGMVSIAEAIRRIQKKYSFVNLFLDDKSRSLKRFYPHYFGSAFTEGTRWFYLDLNPKC